MKPVLLVLGEQEPHEGGSVLCVVLAQDTFEPVPIDPGIVWKIVEACGLLYLIIQRWHFVEVS